MLLGILTSSDPAQNVEAFEGVPVDLYVSPGPLSVEDQETTQSLSPDQAHEAAQPLITARVDDLGNLLLAPVPAGEYVLIVRLPEQEIVIEGLSIEHG